MGALHMIMGWYGSPKKKGPAVGSYLAGCTNHKPQARNREFGRACNALPSGVQTLGNCILTAQAARRKKNLAHWPNLAAEGTGSALTGAGGATNGRGR